MKILLLGSNGFLGKSLQKVFNSHDFNFTTSDIRGESNYKGDLSDLKFVMSLPDADVIINCATVQYVTPNKPIFFKKNYFYKNNVLSLKNLYERYGHSEKTHFIHVGTSMMYEQDSSKLYFPHSKLKASGVYSESKVLGQEIINRFKKTTTVVPCIIAGEGRGGFFKNFILSIKLFKFAILIGGGNHKISLVHVDDVSSLLLRVIEKPVNGLINAAARDSLTIREWISIISNELNVKKFIIVRIPLFLVDIFSKISNYNLLAKEQITMLKMPHVLDINDSRLLGWNPQYTSADIIKETARPYK